MVLQLTDGKLYKQRLNNSWILARLVQRGYVKERKLLYLKGSVTQLKKGA